MSSSAGRPRFDSRENFFLWHIRALYFLIWHNFWDFMPLWAVPQMVDYQLYPVLFVCLLLAWGRAVLEIKLKVLCMLGKCSTAELQSQPYPVIFLLQQLTAAHLLIDSITVPENSGLSTYRPRTQSTCGQGKGQRVLSSSICLWPCSVIKNAAGHSDIVIGTLFRKGL